MRLKLTFTNKSCFACVLHGKMGPLSLIWGVYRGTNLNAPRSLDPLICDYFYLFIYSLLTSSVPLIGVVLTNGFSFLPVSGPMAPGTGRWRDSGPLKAGEVWHKPYGAACIERNEVKIVLARSTFWMLYQAHKRSYVCRISIFCLNNVHFYKLSINNINIYQL